MKIGTKQHSEHRSRISWLDIYRKSLIELGWSIARPFYCIQRGVTWLKSELSALKIDSIVDMGFTLQVDIHMSEEVNLNLH